MNVEPKNKLKEKEDHHQEEELKKIKEMINAINVEVPVIGHMNAKKKALEIIITEEIIVDHNLPVQDHLVNLVVLDHPVEEEIDQEKEEEEDKEKEIEEEIVLM